MQLRDIEERLEEASEMVSNEFEALILEALERILYEMSEKENRK